MSQGSVLGALSARCQFAALNHNASTTAAPVNCRACFAICVILWDPQVSSPGQHRWSWLLTVRPALTIPAMQPGNKPLKTKPPSLLAASFRNAFRPANTLKNQEGAHWLDTLPDKAMDETRKSVPMLLFGSGPLLIRSRELRRERFPF